MWIVWCEPTRTPGIVCCVRLAASRRAEACAVARAVRGGGVELKSGAI